MAARTIRFLHASDLHLERPLVGLAEVPDHLRDLLCDVPYEAARRIFEKAASEQVDFIILAGDVVDTTAAGPRALAFLTDQFERLAAKGICVYWAAGRGESRGPWPESLSLPKNVHVFDGETVTAHVHEIDGESAIELLIASGRRHKQIRIEDFKPARADLPAVAIAYGKFEPQPHEGLGITYWALGGRHARHTIAASKEKAHYAGSPQGRQPSETGPHGTTLVEIDVERQVRTSFVPMDQVRWLHESIAVGDGSTPNELGNLLLGRASELLALHGGADLLVRWTLKASGELAANLRRGTLASDLREQLRSAVGRRRPSLWTSSVSLAEEPALPDSLVEQDTVLGEYLRTLGDYQHDPALALDLNAYLSERHIAGSIGSAMTIDDAETRQVILREAAALGVDLLAGEGA